MKKLIVILAALTSAGVFAQNDLKTLHTVVKSQMSENDQLEFCIKESYFDPNICLMTRAKASEYCKQLGLKLPSAKDFAAMAKQYGAYLGSESCGESNFCQRISPLDEASFFYNSRRANIQGILPEYWYHTSSLREPGANFHFDSASGYMGSASDKNPGNVTCIN